MPYVAAPALRFDAKLTAGATAFVRLDDQRVAALRGTGAVQSTTVCLPVDAAGNVHRLRLETATGEGYNCADAPSSLAFDNVSLVSDPACAESQGLLDPGVELTRRPARCPGRSTSAPAPRAG